MRFCTLNFNNSRLPVMQKHIETQFYFYFWIKSQYSIALNGFRRRTVQLTDLPDVRLRLPPVWAGFVSVRVVRARYDTRDVGLESVCFSIFNRSFSQSKQLTRARVLIFPSRKLVKVQLQVSVSRFEIIAR